MDKRIPVVTLSSVEETAPVLKALKAYGINCAEITFRTACAEEAIKAAVREFPDMNVGAGTVINGGQCRRALAAGAKFIVSPGLSEEVAGICREAGVPYYPGCVTPTEVMRAVNAGFSAVKFFPASAFGGLKTIRALSAPFPGVRVMPTGGVGEDNLAEYLREKSVFACGGSWMVPPRDVAEGNFDKVVSLVKKACAIAAQA